MDSAINIAIKTKLGELSKNGGLDALKAANPLLASQLEEMTAEKIVSVAIRSLLLSSRKLISRPTNVYYLSVKDYIEKNIKEDMKHDKKSIKVKKAK